MARRVEEVEGEPPMLEAHHRRAGRDAALALDRRAVRTHPPLAALLISPACWIAPSNSSNQPRPCKPAGASRGDRKRLLRGDDAPMKSVRPVSNVRDRLRPKVRSANRAARRAEQRRINDHPALTATRPLIGSSWLFAIVSEGLKE